MEIAYFQKYIGFRRKFILEKNMGSEISTIKKVETNKLTIKNGVLDFNNGWTVHSPLAINIKDKYEDYIRLFPPFLSIKEGNEEFRLGWQVRDKFSSQNGTPTLIYNFYTTGFIFTPLAVVHNSLGILLNNKLAKQPETMGVYKIAEYPTLDKSIIRWTTRRLPAYSIIGATTIKLIDYLHNTLPIRGGTTGGDVIN